MNESVFHHHKKGKRHIKAINALSKQTNAPSLEQSIPTNDVVKKGQYSESQILKLKQVAFNETLILRLKSLMQDTVNQTMNQVRKKQSSSYQEIEAEKESLKAKDILAKAVTITGEDSDEDRVKYNPKNLPMGWDGKPIPYWLYKLHGLGKEFKCEICGGASYWGRRAFEKHF
jgi:splicing factor 3A subunit 3